MSIVRDTPLWMCKFAVHMVKESAREEIGSRNQAAFAQDEIHTHSGTIRATYRHSPLLQVNGSFFSTQIEKENLIWL